MVALSPSAPTVQIPSPHESGLGPRVTCHLAVEGRLAKQKLPYQLEVLKYDPRNSQSCSPALLGAGWVQMDISPGPSDQALGSICHRRSLWARMPHLTVRGWGTGREDGKREWCPVT